MVVDMVELKEFIFRGIKTELEIRSEALTRRYVRHLEALPKKIVKSTTKIVNGYTKDVEIKITLDDYVQQNE